MTDPKDADTRVPEQFAMYALSGWLGASPDAIAEEWQRLSVNWGGQSSRTLAVQTRFQAELMNIWLGQSDLAIPQDHRFADPEWEQNPLFSRLRQAYVAWCNALDDWLDGSELVGLDRQRARFLLDAAKDAYAPVNSPFTPEAIREAVATDGQSLVRGVQNYLTDLQHNHGYPSVADRHAFELGKDVAATPGEVIFRNDLLELIQYRPTTERVHKRPLLYVFSQVNRFYLGDLTPDRSLFKQLLSDGIQVFAISWRNPSEAHRQWSLATYAQSVVDALRVVRKVAGVKKVDVMGLCAGGVTAAVAAGLLNADGKNWLYSLSLFVSVLDSRPGESEFGLFATDESVEAQKAKVRSQGFASERDVLEMFAMLRLDESVFSFVRSNYFRGENPPAHPLLYWSMDYTRVPAELQCDFMDLGHTNPLALGHLTVAGRQIDLRNIDYPVYVMAGSTDHITPWNACYRSVHLFAGDVQFVLTNQNHTQTISARPDNRHLKYWLGEDLPETADAWLDHAQEVSGNWRDHWVRWLQGHSTLRAAPDRCGSTTYPPLQAAPGSYVRE